MRRRRAAVLALMISVGLGSATANAATAKKYKSCKTLRTVYPHGITRSANSAVYAMNKHLDRDGDGKACET